MIEWSASGDQPVTKVYAGMLRSRAEFKTEMSIHMLFVFKALQTFLAFLRAVWTGHDFAVWRDHNPCGVKGS
eukprot:1136313-Pelagomonas_calceolata.AAC.6